MRQRLMLFALAFAFVLSPLVPAYAKSVNITVPPGTAMASVVTYGVSNATGNQTSQNAARTFYPVGNSITVDLPNDTSTTTYGGQAYFENAQGSVIGETTFSNADAAGGSGSGSGATHGPVQTKPDY